MQTAWGSELPLIETSTPGCRFEWFDNYRIVAVTLDNPSRTVIDTWIDNSITIRKLWPPDRVLLVVLSLEFNLSMPTPYARARLRELAGVRPEVETYTAIVLKSSPMTRIAQMVVREVSPASAARTRIFFDANVGLDWLRQVGAITA